MRTMLPPNLTRHYYEVRCLIAAGEGKETTPWYRLTADEKAAVDMDVEILRRAIMRAEEEQDLVTSFDASTAENREAAAVEDCDCPGCSAVAAMIELLKLTAERVEASTPLSTRRPISDGPVMFAGVPVAAQKPAQPGSEEYARLERAAREAIEKWVVAGKPLETLPAPAPEGVVWMLELRPRDGWIKADSILREDAESRFDALRSDFWTKRPPFVVKV